MFGRKPGGLSNTKSGTGIRRSAAMGGCVLARIAAASLVVRPSGPFFAREPDTVRIQMNHVVSLHSFEALWLIFIFNRKSHVVVSVFIFSYANNPGVVGGRSLD